MGGQEVVPRARALASPALSALASFVAGRRTKWVVLAIWIVAFAALSPLGSKLADETRDDTTSFLPESAESTEVVSILDEQFEAGETTQGIIVYRRAGGLTEADRAKIAEDARAVEQLSDEELPLVEPPVAPFPAAGGEADTSIDVGERPAAVSPGGDLAFTVLTVPTNFDEAADW